MRALKVWSTVTPGGSRQRLQEVDAGAARVMMFLTCVEKLKWVSKVTPRILGNFSSGRGWFPGETSGRRLDCLVQGVKRVTLDLLSEIFSPLAFAHSAALVAWAERARAASSTGWRRSLR